MVKSFIFLIGLISSLQLFASDFSKNEKKNLENSKLKIVSFLMAGNKTAAAELCVKVSGADREQRVKVISDPGSKKPGVYMFWALPQERSCITIVTFDREATVEIYSQNGKKGSVVKGQALSARL